MSRRQEVSCEVNGNGNHHDDGSDPPLDGDAADRRARHRAGEDVVLLLSVAEVARALGLGRSKTYELIAAGELEVVHIGRCARVPVASVEAYVDRLRRDVPQLNRCGNACDVFHRPPGGTHAGAGRT